MSNEYGINVLISSCGRRVGLLGCFRESIATRGSNAAVLAIDAGSTAPASFLADRSWVVPRCTEPQFVDAVLELATRERVALIVPTIDPELPVYAATSRRFREAGVTVSISSPAVVQISADKVKTHEWLVAHGFPTVRQTEPRLALLHASDWSLPLIAKPRCGSASRGVRRIENWLELHALVDSAEDYIVQEVAGGREFTVNVYVSRSGECVCAVPHWRVEVRAGEVSKGITVKDRGLMELARAVAEALPGAYGPLNIQCFVDRDGSTVITEINARFGGGYPLAHHAGARFTNWLLDELEGKSPPYFDGWMDDLAMLRYDEAVYVPGSRIRAWSGESAWPSTLTTRSI